MAKRVQRRRATTAGLPGLSPAPLAGELLVDTTKQVVVVSDGASLYPMAPESHAHAGTDITSGTVAAARLGTMTGDTGGGGAKGAVPAPQAGDAAAGKYLRADATWAVPPGGDGGSPSGETIPWF